MLAIIAVGISVTVFFVGLVLFNAVYQSKQVICDVNRTIGFIKNPNMSEDEKEIAVQRASLRLLSHFGLILMRGCSALILGFTVLALFHLTNIATINKTMNILEQWQTFVTITIVVSVAAIFLRFRKKSS